MKPVIIVLIVQLIWLSSCTRAQVRRFPSDFKWGVGSSSYQIEGGWNEGGKGESIWDFLTHNHPEKMPDRSNGDITANSYHNWRRDVEMVRELGVSVYRFSLSWPRILPSGFPNHVNKAGIRYYNHLIDELLRYNITPMVTLYHWELPQRLQEIGGWTNAEMIHHFQDFARTCFEHFGNRVKIWTTFNEPWHVCEQAYGQDYMAPAYDFPGIPSYLCGHNLLKAHAEVVHMYREHFQPKHKGQIGITLDVSWPEPASSTEEDKTASDTAMQFYVGWFGHPIYKGNYPQVMIDRVNALSKQQGFTKSRLPRFTETEIERIYNTSDFFGINSYTSNLVSRNDRNDAGYPVPSFMHDMNVVERQDQAWPKSGSEWLRVFPKGMYKLLMWIKKEYDNPPTIVTENGVSDRGGTNDTARIKYFYSYLESVLDAIEDGCNVQGYVAWSLMDSFEWRAGYTEKFGLYHVDFNDPMRKRTPKASAKAYSRISRTNEIDRNFIPTPDVWIPAPGQSKPALQVSSAQAVLASPLILLAVLLQRLLSA